MAVSVTSLAIAGDTSNLASYTTASVVFPANSLAFTCVRNGHGSSADIPQTVTTTGLTWSAVSGGSIQIANANSRVTLYATLVGASAVTGTVTFDWTGGANETQNSAIWSVGHVTGYKPGGVGSALVVKLAATRTAQTSWNSLDAVTAFNNSNHSGTLGFVGIATANENIAPPTGWTELGQDSTATPNGIFEAAWLVTADTTPDWSWTSSSTYAILVVEMVAYVPGVDGQGSGAQSEMIRRRRRR